jgi:hypothetical protein
MELLFCVIFFTMAVITNGIRKWSAKNRVVRHWLPSIESQVHSNSCEIHGGQNEAAVIFSPLFFWVFPANHFTIALYSSVTSEVCDDPDKAAHHCILSLKLVTELRS